MAATFALPVASRPAASCIRHWARYCIGGWPTIAVKRSANAGRDLPRLADGQCFRVTARNCRHARQLRITRRHVRVAVRKHDHVARLEPRRLLPGEAPVAMTRGEDVIGDQVLGAGQHARLRMADALSFTPPWAAGSVVSVVMRFAAEAETGIGGNPTPWAGRKDQAEGHADRSPGRPAGDGRRPHFLTLPITNATLRLAAPPRGDH